jgi:uncharacterized OB-fold protein
MAVPKSVAPWVVVDAEGGAHVEARRCSACEAILTVPSLACPSCGARDSTQPFTVVSTGRLHSYSIVHRSFPGVAVPFISVVVDMDDGTVLKGNLRGVEPKPDSIRFDMPVKLVFDDAGRSDREGNSYISYFFEAA